MWPQWDESIARMTAIIDQPFAYLRERQQTYAGPMDTTDVGNVIEQYKHYQVPIGYAPYIRKRKPPHENATPDTQEIPQKLLITQPTTLPPWTRPEPTPPPGQLTPPTHPAPATSPLPPTPSTSQTPSQPHSNTIHPIPSLMSITFTPHTISQIKSRLSHRQIPSFNIPPRPPVIPLIPLIHTVTHLVNTVNHMITTMYTNFNGQCYRRMCNYNRYGYP